jgi:hypothetical protein
MATAEARQVPSLSIIFELVPWVDREQYGDWRAEEAGCTLWDSYTMALKGVIIDLYSSL